MRRLSIVLVLFPLILGGVLWSQAEAGYLSGNLQLKVQGSRAYVAANIREQEEGADWQRWFFVLDIATSTEPVVLGQLELDQAATSFEVRESLVFLRLWLFGEAPRLDVLDFTEPDNPRLVGQLGPEEPYANINDFDVDGDYVYLAGNRELRVVDMSDLSAPRQVASLEVAGLDVNMQIKVSSPYAYLWQGGWFGDVVIVDISQPTEPRELGRTDVEGSVHLTYAYQDYLYVFWQRDCTGHMGRCKQYGTTIVDVSDPTTPVTVGEMNRINLRTGAVDDNGVTLYAFYTNPGDTYRIWSLADPAHPRQVGQCLFDGPDTRLQGFYARDGQLQKLYVDIDNYPPLSFRSISLSCLLRRTYGLLALRP